MWVLAAFCTLVSGAITGMILINNHEKSLELQLTSTAATLMSLGISDYSGLKGFQELDKFVEDTIGTEKIDQIITVYSKRGKPMFSSRKTTEDDLKLVFKPVKKAEFSVYDGKRKYKILTAPYTAKNGKDYFLQIAMIYPLFKEVMKLTITEAITLFAILSVLSFIIAQMLAKKLVRPVRHIANYLNGLDPTDTKNWMPLVMGQQGDYLYNIVQGINALVVRVKSAIYSISRTSRFLAHELRNPLTILTGEAEDILAKKDASHEEFREVIKSTLEEVDRMNNVVETILKIVRKEKLSYSPVHVNLNSMIGENVERWKLYLGIDLIWKNADKDIIGLLDPDLLIQLIDNLIRNIKKHAGATTAVITLSEVEEHVNITVEDNGIGMESDLLYALNNNDVTNKRMGIGLMLCLEITSICHFKTSFYNKEGGGLLVRIKI